MNLATLLAFNQIIGVIPFVTYRLTVFDFDDALTGPIQKITIVTDDYESQFVALQKLFEPFNGVDIEMVRRLIKQKNVRLGKQQARQSETILLTTRKFFSFKLPGVSLETEALQDRFGFGGIFEATFALKLVLQVAVP